MINFIKNNCISKTKLFQSGVIIKLFKKYYPLFKYSFSFLIFIEIFIFINKNNNLKLNRNYLYLQKKLGIKLDTKIKNKIRIAFYIYKLDDGGMQRITSLILFYFQNIKIFDLYLFSLNIYEDELFVIPKKVERVFLKDKNIYNVIRQIKKKKIHIFLYQFPNYNEINILNRLKNNKIIFYQHSSFFFFFYNNYQLFKSIYKEYINSKYIVSIIPLENDYIFKSWGINSILMDNFVTYQFKNIRPSDLSSKTILMLGRAYDIYKRFNLGILTMDYIIKEIPECQMKIISKLNNSEFLQDLTYNMNLENNVEFVGFNPKPEIYFKNASLHILPSLSESFSMALCETKIYGIPNILLGLNYVSLSKGGTVIIYDESPESIAKESIKILKNYNYRRKLAKEARLSTLKLDNKFLLNKWIKLILSVYKGDIYYQKLKNNDKKLSKREALNMLGNQLILIKKRKPNYRNITINILLNFSILYNINITN